MEKFKISQFQARTLSWWKLRRKTIDMDPSYQRRGKLWSPTDKGYLIDSILNGFDIPKVYMADFTWGDSKLNKKKLPYAIIDGKQRMEAIFDFFEDTVTLNDDFILLSQPSLKLAGLGYKDLMLNHPEVAEEFDNYNLDIMSVQAQSEEPIHELFVRLNRSKSLTGAEIRNAMLGPAPKMIREMARHEFFKDYIKFDTTRGQDLNAAAKILAFEFNGGPIETKKNNLDRFVGEMENKSSVREKLELSARRALDILDSMAAVFLPKDKLLGSAGSIPVYYWLVREIPQKKQHKLRSFLVEFEAEQKEHRLLARDPNNTKLDSELSEYDKLSRSTNDQNSHIGRFQILLSRFKARNP